MDMRLQQVYSKAYDELRRMVKIHLKFLDLNRRLSPSAVAASDEADRLFRESDVFQGHRTDQDTLKAIRICVNRAMPFDEASKNDEFYKADVCLLTDKMYKTVLRKGLSAI